MKKLSDFKIYSLALWHLFIPKIIRRRFFFRTSGIENIAIATAMNKIKYWRHFIRKKPMDKTIHFTAYKE